jgi:hypothetical protein
VQRDETARHEPARGLIRVLHELGYFFAAIEGGQGLGLFRRLQLLDDVRDDVVFDFFEDGRQVFDADPADQVTQFIVFCVFEELPDDVGRQLIEQRVTGVFRESEDEFGEVSRVEGSYKRDKFRPLTRGGKCACVIQDIAGSEVFWHCAILR